MFGPDSTSEELTQEEEVHNSDTISDYYHNIPAPKDVKPETASRIIVLLPAEDVVVS